MKTTLEKELKIDNTQYGVIAGAHSLTNTVFPIISGLLIDRYGPNAGSFASSSAIFVGALLTALGTSNNSYPLVVVGQVVFGLGNLTIESEWLRSLCSYPVPLLTFLPFLPAAQSKFYVKYCKCSVSGGPGTLAFVNGLDIGLVGIRRSLRFPRQLTGDSSSVRVAPSPPSARSLQYPFTSAPSSTSGRSGLPPSSAALRSLSTPASSSFRGASRSIVAVDHTLVQRLNVEEGVLQRSASADCSSCRPSSGCWR